MSLGCVRVPAIQPEAVFTISHKSAPALPVTDIEKAPIVNTVRTVIADGKHGRYQLLCPFRPVGMFCDPGAHFLITYFPFLPQKDGQIILAQKASGVIL